MNFTVDRSLIEPILQAQIEAAIARELGTQGEIIQALVAAALNERVNGDGRKSQYESDNKYRFLAVTVRNKIQEAARLALVEYLEANEDAVREAVVAAVERDKDAMVRAFVDSMLHAASQSWRVRVEFTVPKDE